MIRIYLRYTLKGANIFTCSLLSYFFNTWTEKWLTLIDNFFAFLQVTLMYWFHVCSSRFCLSISFSWSLVQRLFLIIFPRWKNNPSLEPGLRSTTETAGDRFQVDRTTFDSSLLGYLFCSWVLGREIPPRGKERRGEGIGSRSWLKDLAQGVGSSADLHP